MTREEAQSLYAQGEEAVVSFLMEITARLQAIEDRLSKDSHNSQ